MSIKSLIQDGEGTKRTAGVTDRHALKVTSVPQSLTERVEQGNFEDLLQTKLLYTTFKNSSDSENLNVNGSVTNQDFYIAAEENQLKSIYEVRFVLNDEQMALGSSEGRRFASAAASPGLTNGIQFFVTQGGVDTQIFATPVKQIYEFLHWSTDFINEVGALGSGEDLLVVGIKFHVPVNIVPGGIDKMTIRIRDNLTNINFFIVTAIGSKELL